MDLWIVHHWLCHTLPTAPCLHWPHLTVTWRINVVYQDITFFQPLSLPPSLHPKQQDPIGSAFSPPQKDPLAREERAEFIPWVARTKSENTVVYTGQTLNGYKFVLLHGGLWEYANHCQLEICPVINGDDHLNTLKGETKPKSKCSRECIKIAWSFREPFLGIF